MNGTEDAASAIRRLATRDLKATYGRAALEEKVPTWLEPGEAVLALASCTLAGRWWQEANPKRSRLIVATDRRLLLLPFGLLMADGLAREAREPEPDSLAYAEIKEIEEKRAWWESKLDVRMKGREVLLTSLRKKTAFAIADAVRENLSSGS